MEGIIRAWGKILAGYQPNLSIEITRECPLTCPGCYAYGGGHLGGDITLRELQDFNRPRLERAIVVRADLDDGRPLTARRQAVIARGRVVVVFEPQSERAHVVRVAAPAVAARRPAARHELLAAERRHAVAAVPPSDSNLDAVDEQSY